MQGPEAFRERLPDKYPESLPNPDQEQNGGHPHLEIVKDQIADTASIDDDTMDLLLNESVGTPSKFLYADEEERELIAKRVAASAAAKLSGTDSEDLPTQNLVRSHVRNEYVEALKEMPWDSFIEKVDEGIKRSPYETTAATSRLIGTFSMLDSLTIENEAEPKEVLRPRFPGTKPDLYSIIHTDTDQSGEGVLKQVIDYLDEHGETRNKMIFEQYFVADRPLVSIGKDLGLREAGMESIIKRVCHRLRKAEINVDRLLEDSTRSPSSSPQDKVVKWISWSQDRNFGVIKSDEHFVLRELPRWNLQKFSENGPKINSFKTPLKSFKETGLLETLGKILPQLDRSISLQIDEDKIRLNMRGELTPYHLQVLAIADYILENNAYKTAQRLKLAGEGQNYQPETGDRPKMLNQTVEELFSDREIEVFARINRSSANIASDLLIEDSTARTHAHHIYEKTGMQAETLTLLSYELGYLVFDDETDEAVARDTKDLSSREKDVMQLLALGMTYDEIADKLYIRTSTVRTHLHKSYKKLGVEDSNNAVLCAYIKEQIDLPIGLGAYIQKHS